MNIFYIYMKFLQEFFFLSIMFVYFKIGFVVLYLHMPALNFKRNSYCYISFFVT